MKKYYFELTRMGWTVQITAVEYKREVAEDIIKHQLFTDEELESHPILLKFIKEAKVTN